MMNENKKKSNKSFFSMYLFFIFLILLFILFLIYNDFSIKNIKSFFGINNNVIENMGSNVVNKSDTVYITYDAVFEDGSLFEQKTLDDKYSFVVGNGNVISGLENGILGMKEGLEKEIIIEPNNGYGKYYDVRKSNKKISVGIFSVLGIETKLGKYYTIKDIQGKIKDIVFDNGKEYVIIDSNNRETMDNILYKVKVVKIIKNN